MAGTFQYPVVEVSGVNDFKIKVPMGGSGTITATDAKKCTSGVFHYIYKAGGRLPSYMMEKSFTDIATAKYLKYQGLVCSKLGFSVGPTGAIELSSDWMGAKETVGSASFDTGTTIDNGKSVFDASMLAAADCRIGPYASPTAVATMKKLDFSIDNGLDGDTFVIGGQGERGGINPGIYQITGNVTALFADATLYEAAKNSTLYGIDLHFKRGDGAGALDNESLRIIVPYLKFTPKAPSISGPGGLLQELQFVGAYYNTDDTAMKVIVTSPKLPGAVL
jgi:hypothetical protein